MKARISVDRMAAGLALVVGFSSVLAAQDNQSEHRSGVPYWPQSSLQRPPQTVAPCRRQSAPGHPSAEQIDEGIGGDYFLDSPLAVVRLEALMIAVEDDPR